jgi:hypothetical protein
MKSKTKVIVLVALMILLQIPTYVSAWDHTKTSNYQYGDDTQTGSGWTVYSWSTSSGDIKIQMDHWQGWDDSSCHIWIGALIHSPESGEYTVTWEMKHLVSYSVGGIMGTWELSIKQELQDDENGVDDYWESHSDSGYGGSYNDYYDDEYESDVILVADSDYYIVLHVYMEFVGWIWMDPYPSSGYSDARFDLAYIYWSFVEA